MLNLDFSATSIWIRDLISFICFWFVFQAAWPIFSDWGKILDEPGPWYERGNSQGNECEDRSNASYNDQHRQSPIMLQDDDACTDRHKLVNIEVCI